MPTPEAVKIAISEWEDEVKNLSLEQIKKGLEKCKDPFGRHVEFPPTLPQFICLCFPDAEEIGIPSVEEAYRQALCPSLERHSLVQNAIDCIGSYTFKMMSEAEARRRFMPIYAQLRDRSLKECLRNENLMLGSDRYGGAA